MIIRPIQKDDAKAGFSCGEPGLDVYLAKRAWAHACDGIATVYVLEDPSAPQHIVGFYTLSNKSVDAAVLAPILKKSLPKFPVPVTYIGCFAVSRDRQRQGHGLTLMGDALERCLTAANHVGSLGVFLDSLSPKSTDFYKQLGFIEILPLVASHQPMFLPMASLRKA